MSWPVALPALDVRGYIYRIHAPAHALRADRFRAAFHCHDDGPRPRASDRFDAALIWRAGAERTDHADLTVHQH
ncbi:hypothetical protein ACIQZB_36005 [Streptomyces sp. NPDC097727]|uniref:hypothetical protein n=1 Tax=Streptomyces sp. NPDC097727 TaxID=3366092 RepID=UPI003823C977